MNTNSINTPVVIYGAQAIAYSVFKALKAQGVKVLFYVVSDREGNPDSIAGVPVISLQEYIKWREASFEDHNIFICTPENVQEAISEAFVQNGCDNFLCIDSVKLGELMMEYYSMTDEFIPLESLCKTAAVYAGNMCCDAAKAESDLADKVCIYKAKHEKDRALKNAHNIKPWVKEIQVGAAISANRMSGNILHDDAGENISDMNHVYAELTGLYWAWKNSNADIIGLAHYRRYLDIDDKALQLLLNREIDVILPYPMSHYPYAGSHHKRWVRDDDWNAIMRAVKELYPTYCEDIEIVLSQEYFYNYNLFCAVKDVLDDYCKWLFSIFELAQTYIGHKEPKYIYKYFGYAGESMCTLFFMINRHKYRKAHAKVIMEV